ncbi:endothelin-converting enzyme 2-like [Actinia tenebrosa]|uniref:Endothelin-converting enzyme 2-like n=1 Tax=Actinia tenebrosa TaxID=6105 RepID=A0A6P8I8R4_ACTTE|nr:endothelin-converting enzyme 2-like [Actinia tenebrosa]
MSKPVKKKIAVPLAEHNWEFTVTLEELKEEAPEYDWEDHLNAIFAPTKMAEDELLVIPGLPFMKKVGKLIKETPKRVLANFLGWRLIEDEPYYLSKAYRDARQEFDNAKEGTEGSKERWRTCVVHTDKFVGDILGAPYIKKHFDRGTRDLAVKMIDRVREAFKENVDSLPWMDQKTKTAVAEKVDKMKVALGYPDYYIDGKKLPEKFSHYKNVVIRDNKFFQNRWNLMKMFHKKMIRKLRLPVDKELWRMNPQIVNAMNDFSNNMIVFPAGILQKPFFYGNGIPCALSYGGIGAVIAHEITHGFDDDGMYYNKNGEVLDTPWWTNKSISEFKTRMGCLEDQYSDYKVGGKYPINGKLTLGENIADNGGFMATSKAYYGWLKENSNNLVKLPGLDLTNEQLLYVGLGQTFCQNKKPEKQYQDTLEDFHTENKFRVIGILSNSHEFAKAFKCKKNSPMNPEKKCAIWNKDGPLDI